MLIGHLANADNIAPATARPMEVETASTAESAAMEDDVAPQKRQQMRGQSRQQARVLSQCQHQTGLARAASW